MLCEKMLALDLREGFRSAVRRSDVLISLGASMLLLSMGMPLAGASTHDLDGVYQYQIPGASGMTTYQVKIGGDQLEFKNPADEHDPRNHALPAAIEEGAVDDFAAAIGNRPHPGLFFYRTRFDLRANGKLVDVTIVRKMNTAGRTAALYFYIVASGRPFPIITEATPVLN